MASWYLAPIIVTFHALNGAPIHPARPGIFVLVGSLAGALEAGLIELTHKWRSEEDDTFKP